MEFNIIEYVVELTFCDIFKKEKFNCIEISERIIEFEVVKDDIIDMISLNTLYDYYNVTFDEAEFLLTRSLIENSILNSNPTNVLDRIVKLQLGQKLAQ